MKAIKRPLPPRKMPNAFTAAPQVEDWIRASFLDENSKLYNPDHKHLASARLGCLWTSVLNLKQGRQIMGFCEVPNVQGHKWLKGRMEMQLEDWFGAIPDFLLTFYAPHAYAISDAEWCALSEHEVYHCGQKLDAFDMPKFTDEGKPVLGIRGHDVEEFTGIVRRYGMGATNSQVREFVEAANRPPEVASASIRHMCGTCLARAA